MHLQIGMHAPLIRHAASVRLAQQRFSRICQIFVLKIWVRTGDAILQSTGTASRPDLRDL
jgi:hypothetical protein